MSEEDNKIQKDTEVVLAEKMASTVNLKESKSIGMGDLVKAIRMIDYCIHKNAFEEQDLDEVKKVYNNLNEFSEWYLQNKNVSVEWVNEANWHPKSL